MMDLLFFFTHFDSESHNLDDFDVLPHLWALLTLLLSLSVFDFEQSSPHRFRHVVLDFQSGLLCYTLSQGLSRPRIRVQSWSSGVQGRVGRGFSEWVAAPTRLLHPVFSNRQRARRRARRQSS